MPNLDSDVTLELDEAESSINWEGEEARIRGGHSVRIARLQYDFAATTI